MGQGFLVDTNTVIDYIGEKLPENSLELIDDLEINLSVVSRIELLVWRNVSDEQLQVVKDFIDASKVFGLDEQVILESIEIRKNYRLKLPDAIIAATAIVKKLTLLTRNIKDFERIANLNCIDPYQL